MSSFSGAHVGSFNAGHVNAWNGHVNTWNGHVNNWNGHVNSAFVHSNHAWVAGHPWDHNFWHGGHFWYGNHGFYPWYGFAWWPWYDFGWWPGYYDYYPYRVGYYGGYGYDNGPYAVEYAAPDTSDEMPNETPLPQPAVGEEPSGFYTEALSAFQEADYANAVRLAGHAAIDQPRDANVHLLLSLGLFALGDYRGAAIESHAVAAIGSIPTWPTVYGFYNDVDRYTTQLRALEKFVQEHPKSPEGRFLLGFQYAAAGHSDAAKNEFLEAVTLAPRDRLAAQLLTKEGGTVPPSIADKQSKLGTK